MEPKRCACVASAAHNVAVLAAAHGASSLGSTSARLAQSVERKALNLVVVGSSPTVGAFPFLHSLMRAAGKTVQHATIVESLPYIHTVQ